MAQSINLIPQQEVQEQQKTQLVKFSTVFTILLLIGVGAASAFYFYKSLELKNNLEATNSDIDRLRSEITALSPIEVSARNLDKKYNVLKTLFETRTYHSLLVKEVELRKPTEVTIDSFSLQKDNKLNISGVSDTYVSIAAFTNNLLDKEFPSGDPNLKALFSEVSLTSVNLDKQKNLVRFSVVVTYNSDLLRKK